MNDEDDALLKMGWTLCHWATYEPGRITHYHQVTKGGRRLSYHIVTTHHDLRAALSPPTCEIQQTDGTWIELPWREWAEGGPDKDYPFPFPE